MYLVIRDKFELIVHENNLPGMKVMIRAKPLTPKEAIGTPKREDFPILKGREQLIQAEFRGSLGQVFTDMPGNFQGTLRDVLNLELTDNFSRAVFFASLNAVMKDLGMIKGSVHCKDRGPEECGADLLEFLGKYGKLKIALVGFQPVHAQCCMGLHDLKILDLDNEIIGEEKFGVVILDGSIYAEEVLKWCDLALVTGTTVVNGTIDTVLDNAGEKSVFYGISIAGAACLLGLKRFCPRST